MYLGISRAHHARHVVLPLDAQELQRVLALGGFPLIGVNNRDLTSFETDLSTTEQLAEQFADELKAQGALLVSESGLFVRADLDRCTLLRRPAATFCYVVVF